MAESKTPHKNAESLITEHLDIWTTAIEQKSSSGRGSSKKFSLHGIKKLRELILELAVRGKLVPQDPNDEPASVLLERIAAEKAQLVKDKKIKKPKVLPEISEDEKPFELPKGWEWTRLGEVGSIVGGGTPKSGEASYWCEEGIKWLTPADLYGRKEKFISSGKRDITEEGLAKSSAQLLPVNSILFSSRAPIGYVVIASSPLATNQGFKSIVPFLNGFSEYIYYYLKRSARYIDDAASGTTFKEVSGLIVSKLLISLPPVLEQQRIVAKVDELMDLCDALEAQTENSITAHQTLVEVLLEALLKAPEEGATPEQATAQFQQNWQRLSEHFDTLFTTTASIDTLKQTILQLAVMGKLVPQNSNDEPAAKLLERIAVEKAQLIKDKKIKKQKPLPEITDEEKLFELPNGWEWVRLESIAKNEKNSLKAGPFGSALKKSMYVESGYKIYGQEQVISGDENIGDYFIDKDKYHSLLSCRVSAGDMLISLVGTIGKVLVLSKNFQAGIINPRLVKISLNENIIREYIKIILGSKLIQDELLERSHGSTMNVLNLGLLKELAFPLPPPREQRLIVAKVDELIALCDQLKARLTDAQTTKLHLTDAIVEQAL
ncbi:restriction endonuclease subunit S (plasmid) [Pseudoalteromonas sp. HL-AS2]|uniref:restriction endonuclease subunit S n=1 Tax=Pseudoalteromonas sp. HL-AS2 TaxID=3071082 RepID=UPI0028155E62|nr:restriction endonuclease subunit S [Pseudoalteromonas sp. HL-AS2]WMS96184.1 restriction endonuclease subunit S [Pseudoalteromonas sp. HL-AS2]